ncbi:phosphotransferase [Conexibacter sp. DBS9H8]|uniref:maltokinase N-terminal cap-like domain-containing protein n=1 Tax=Conexibacter sp. DBS9H8 TaxID=2937801 RepID=UPI00200F0476|nr:phosphotransferase [Conexibacter sp. DBS9H8]
MSELTDWLIQQRWYASKSLEIARVQELDAAPLPGGEELRLIAVSFTNGTHALYQLVPALSAGVPDAIAAAGEHRTEHGLFCFRSLLGDTALARPALAPVGAEQSNTSVIVDDTYVLKVFRRLEAGINPELEMLRFLSARHYPHIATLRGWYEYESPALACTLGVLQDLIPDGHDGWQLALAEIPTAPDSFLARAASLGEATATLHSVLATDHDDPAFAPEEPSNESVALLRAKVDEDIERMFLALPDNPALAPLSGRGADVRERLAAWPQISAIGKMVRLHGDYHLGQTLARPDGSWVLLDFEGEPARSLSQRRMKRSPLRDVASMLRSFAYAVAAVGLAGETAPDGIETAAREAFLSAYLDAVDPSLLPSGSAAIDNLLGIFELEKAIYELGYELDHRPDWVSIPVAGIEALLAA